MKSQLLKITGLFIGLVFVFSLLPQTAATVVWEDNFDDGNYNGWTVTEGGYEVIDSNYLRTSFPEGAHHCRIWHSSDQVVGTWSFDIRPSAFQCEVLFMANGTDPPEDYDGYGIKLTEDYISLIKRKGSWDGGDTTLAYSSIGDTESKWTHIDVTCDDTGEFNVYVNATSNSAIPIINAVDTEFSYSERFVLDCHWALSSFDNITVDNEILITPIPTTTSEPTTTTTPTDTSPTTTDGGTTPPPISTTLLIIGAGVGGVVIIAAVVCMRRR